MVKTWLAAAFLLQSTAMAGTPVDLEVSATISPGTSLAPGITGTIELVVRNVGGAPAFQSGFIFGHDLGAADYRFEITRTIPPCDGSSYVLDGQPGSPDRTGFNGALGFLAPGQTATCVAEFVVYPDASGVVTVLIGASEPGETNFTNTTIYQRLVLGTIAPPTFQTPAVVRAWDETTRWVTAAIIALIGGWAAGFRNRRE